MSSLMLAEGVADVHIHSSFTRWGALGSNAVPTCDLRVSLGLAQGPQVMFLRVRGTSGHGVKSLRAQPISGATGLT